MVLSVHSCEHIALSDNVLSQLCFYPVVLLSLGTVRQTTPELAPTNDEREGSPV